MTAALELTTPAAMPPSTATNAITVTCPDVVCPLVVIVELAQRSTASLVSRTSTVQPCRCAPAASVRSTTSCGASTDTVTWLALVGVTDPPPAC